jgi:hypothetical protein
MYIYVYILIYTNTYRYTDSDLIEFEKALESVCQGLAEVYMYICTYTYVNINKYL